MAGVIELLSGAVSLSVAKQRLRNVVHAAQYPEQKRAFYERLEGQRDTISAVVCHHLGILSSQCVVSPQAYWRHGSFNLCVPIAVLTQDESMPKHVMVRLPLPYRTGEAQRPGNADEKLRCEAAAYAWIQQFCPEVPIPQLYGFGLSSGQRFTRSDFLPWWSRWLQRARCSILALFGLPLPSQYVGHPARHVPRLETGYLIIETITSGDMLSETWKEKQEDASLQRNLYRDLARIILSLASIPLPRIGAFRLDDNGYLHLDNRPLSTEIVMQENEGIPVEIPRSSTFSTVDEFILMQLALFDARTVHQPNAIESNGDGYRQMSSRAAAKAAFPQMFRQDLRSGPFAFTLTDLHPSNIIVDDEWNVVSIIDLEFSCSWPLEFQQPPYWLGGELVDVIDRATFAPKHEQFVQALEEQERLRGRGDTKSLSSTMREAWASGTFWITLAFIDPIGFTDIFHDRIVPYHLSYITERVKDNDYWLLASLWRPNDAEFLERKLKDRERYLAELEKLAEKEVEPETALTAGAATT